MSKCTCTRRLPLRQKIRFLFISRTEFSMHSLCLCLELLVHSAFIVRISPLYAYWNQKLKEKGLMFNTRNKQKPSVPKRTWVCSTPGSTALCTKGCTPHSTTLRSCQKNAQDTEEIKTHSKERKAFHRNFTWGQTENWDARKDVAAHPYKIKKKLLPQTSDTLTILKSKRCSSSLDISFTSANSPTPFSPLAFV